MARDQRQIRDLNLDALDALPAADLALFLAADERPLQAAAGLVDWRVNGWLSLLVLKGQFVGQREERLLTLGQGRVPAPRIFLFGVGEARAFHHKVAEELGGKFAVALADAGVAELTVGLPGAGDFEAHAALLQSLSRSLPQAKMTTWGPWHKMA